MISIYVGNLPYDTTDEQLVELFRPFGEVHRASLVTDRETGRPRGFGFVEMPDQAEANKAIEALGGTDFNGRPLTVNEARRNTNRNTANLSRSARIGPRPDAETPDNQGSTGYAGKPEQPADSEATTADHSDSDDDGGDTETDGPPLPGGYRNDMRES